jgi:hypothetical protein
MKIDSFARYALIGAFAVSLACAKKSEETTTGRVAPVDTGATVRITPEPPQGDTAGKAVVGDTVPAPPAVTDSARMRIDTTHMPPDSGAGLPKDTSSGAGWPKDTTHGGWSTPPDSGQ